MHKLASWTWFKIYMPPTVAKKKGNIVRIMDIALTSPEQAGDVTRFHNHPVCLLTGDGNTLIEDVREFESWNIPHDLYCVNRSMMFFDRQVDHWAAIDIEESTWFSQNVSPNQEPHKRIIRHTIGDATFAFDVYWKMMYEWKNDYQRRVFVGSTGYFAMLTAIHMGYEKIVLAGMPLNFDPHWYEPDAEEGPMWGGFTFAQWMDFKMGSPNADKVRSLSGYSAFIIGKANKEWVVGDRI